ncbi:MAG: T9SS type A sorting domain-containing protein [Bacteroidales bacterium]|nr:T9SS type A sorting domain-containing protein [Bacteroidales bacterium]
MKRIVAILFVMATMFGAMAQWSSNVDESLLIYSGETNVQEIAMAPNGNTWVYLQAPANDGTGNLSVYLQLLDSAGNKVFGEEPLLVSNKPTRTWTTCNTYLYADRDGNAIVAVHDIRNAVKTQYLSYTLYKISQKGEFLWGEDGIGLEGTQAFPMNSHISMAQMDDNSYVCAWTSVKGESDIYEVKIQRISPDGEMLWDLEEVKLSDPENKSHYTWPTVIDAGMNQAIIVYFKGSNYDIYARKIDFDGTSAWSEDTRLYRSGWPYSIPAWSLVDVQPSGDGGVLVAWSDDRFMTGMATYMTYVQPNGEIGFAAGVDGQKLSYGDYQGVSVRCKYDPYTDTFLAIWRESYSAVMYRALVQRLSKDGELLWGEEGLEIQPFTSNQYGYFSIQTAPDNQAAFFYMHNQTQFSNTNACVTLVNTADTAVRKTTIFTDTLAVCEKSDLLSTSMHNNSYWTVLWNDDYVSTNSTIRMHRINADLTLGNPNSDDAVEAVRVDDTNFMAVSTIVDGVAMFATNVSSDTQATLAVYDINGALVATPFEGVLAAGKQYIEWNADVPAGIYLATLSTPYGIETIKVVVQ